MDLEQQRRLRLSMLQKQLSKKQNQDYSNFDRLHRNDKRLNRLWESTVVASCNNNHKRIINSNMICLLEPTSTKRRGKETFNKSSNWVSR